MGLGRQIWVLTRKNIKIALYRQTWATCIRAFWLPIAFMAFLSYARYLLSTPNTYGVGLPHPVRSLEEGLQAASGGRNTVVFVNNGYHGGDIDRVIDILSTQASARTVERLEDPIDLLTTCRSSLRGVTRCYGAVVFNASPTEGQGGLWNYTLRVDGSLGNNIDVTSDHNDGEIYLFPLQRAVDYAIASINTTIDQAALPGTIDEFMFTDITQHAWETNLKTRYHRLIVNVLAAAFLIGMVGVCYHLTGFLASEREMGMSQLLEAMMPNSRRWAPRVARLASYHLGFTIIYAPGWVIIGMFLSLGAYTNTSAAIVILYHLLAGLALVSWSILGGVCFKKAQLSGITIAVITLVLGIIVQVLDKRQTVNLYILGLLFSPCNYVLFILSMSFFERQSESTNLVHSPPNAWDAKPIILWIFLVVQIILYPLLAFYIEKFLHGTVSNGRTIVNGGLDGDTTVELTNFSKHYPPSFTQRMFSGCHKNRQTPVVAVKNLNLTAMRGQILCLLGANGSGKSTTLDAIAGLNPVTSGHIKVDGTGGIGICPQKNVLWGDLSVKEHIQIFNSLKSMVEPDSSEKRAELISAVDLDRKTNARAKTLSGGQKRKLQLGMMLAGGSAICAVDEVSSGLDPLSRRKIWSILMSIRGDRTIILTTHFLDEADLLADKIAILSKGTLRAEGSAAALKERLGGGYRVNLSTGEDSMVSAPDVPGIPTQTSFDQTTYMAENSAQAAQIVRVLERNNIENFELHEPTIENCFLRLADEIKIESEIHANRTQSPTSNSSKSSEKNTVTFPTIGSSDDVNRLELLSGCHISSARQSWVLFRKRITLLRRNWAPYAAAFLIPVIASGIVTILVENQSPPSCAPGSGVWPENIQNIANQVHYKVLAGPSERFPVKNATDYFDQLFSPYPGDGFPQYSTTELYLVNSSTQFSDFVDQNFANLSPGGYFLGDATTQPTFAYVGDARLFNGVFGQNILNSMLMNLTIVTGQSSFDIPWAPGTGNSLQLIVYFCLAFSAYPALLGLYPTVERVRNVRSLEYSNGVRPLPLWLAYVAFDTIIVLVSSAVVMILLAAGSNVWYELGYMYLILVLFGIASILLAYVVSLFSGTQLATFAMVAGAEAVLFLGYLVAYVCTITYAPVQSIDTYLLVVHFTISLITPMGSLVRGLFVALNLFSTSCDGFVRYSSPGNIKLYGGPILYLILQIFVLFGILLWYDSKFSIAMLRKSKRAVPELEDTIVNEEAADELKHVTSSNDGLRVLHLTKAFGKAVAVEDLTFGVTRGEVFALLGPNGAGKSTSISLIRGDIQASGGDIFVANVAVRKHRDHARSYLGVCPQFDAMDQLTVLEHLRFYARIRGVSDIEHNVHAVISAVGLQAFSSRMASKLSGGNKRKLSLGIALMGNPKVLLLDEPSSGMDAAAKRVMWSTLQKVVPGRAILLTTHSMEEAAALASRAGIMAKRMLALGTTEQLRRKHGDAYHVHLVTKTAPNSSTEEMTRLRDWALQQFPGSAVEERTYHGQMRFAVPASLPHPQQQHLEPSEMDVPSLKAPDTHIDEIRDQGSDVSGSISRIEATSRSGIAGLITVLEDHKESLGLAHYSVSPTTLDTVFLNIVEKHNIEEENYAPLPPPHPRRASSLWKSASAFLWAWRAR
ncbi:MAG: hypothetical protein M1818_003380 [Claussenomyces sp. TS43310]|nr:MAG: hypothetical protein M1818_003380 [Claussenomyces sp. TS43310]